MSSASYVIDVSARSQDADVWFALPPGFVPLPLRELAEAEDSSGKAGSGSTPGLLPAALPDAMARRQSPTDLGPVLRLAQLFLEAGTVLCCLGVHADDEGDGRMLLSLFTLASRPSDWAPRSVLAARAAAGAQDAEHIETLDLPCGPGSLVQRRLSVPPENGKGTQRELLQATAYVPCPDGRRIAILALATTAVNRARHYRALLEDVVRTVSFDNPLRDVFDDASGKD
ncbi:hypothetical protein [Streptomyces sp. NPDC020996]|uniref:hypothetical protein n=1 Tax=Streptomyces sp. NPDC020996 TaxID=3154791 RepID=UPI0033DAC551